jgi:protein-tyrosine phosphatase
MRGINEHRRTAATPHPHERYLPEEVLLPLLELRGGSLLAFVRSLNTKDFLQRHGVTAPELRAILAKLSR